MSDRRRRLGDRGEELVAQWYIERGFQILDRQWRCRRGEIDLVVAGPGLVVFCEVKTRSSDAYGSPFAAVGPRKQERLRELALLWLSGQTGSVGRMRFDVAGVVKGRVEVIEAAF